MFGVFLCYRRIDKGAARRLKDVFVERLGPANVFLDVDAIGFEYGSDFRTVMQETMGIVSAVVVVIGQGNWAGRLWEPDDVVRMELREALAQERIIVPVLVDSATMPKSREYPPELADIAFLNAAQLRTDRHFDQDAKRVLAGIGLVLAQRMGKAKGWDFIRNPDGTTNAL